MQNPPLPETGFIRLREVLRRIPFSKSTLYERIKAGSFPKPSKLGPRISAWHVDDIRKEIENLHNT